MNFNNDPTENEPIDPFRQRAANDVAEFQREARFHPRTQAYFNAHKPTPRPKPNQKGRQK